jgi:hypothetical protein
MRGRLGAPRLQAGISRLNAELYRALAEARRQANGAL